MRTKFIIKSTFITMLILGTLSACSLDFTSDLHLEDVKEDIDKKEGLTEENGVDGEHVEDKEEDSAVHSNFSLHEKLDFNKEILLIDIMEVNNEALHERPLGGIASQSSYMMDENTLFLFYDANLPTEDTNMIITESSFNQQYLLNYNLHHLNENNAQLNIESVDNEYVNNNGRLFLNNEINVEHSGSGNVVISIGGKSVEIASGEEGEIVKVNGETESKIIIMNYGLINSIDNIIYEELNEVDKSNIPNKYKRESDWDEEDLDGEANLIETENIEENED